MSDSADAALAAEGDYPAFERLYRRYVSRIYSLCTRLSGSPTNGEELTEEVFVTAWEKLPQFRGESAFATWLHRLATNVALNGRKVDETAAATVEQEGSATERWNDASTSHDVERVDLGHASFAALPVKLALCLLSFPNARSGPESQVASGLPSAFSGRLRRVSRYRRRRSQLLWGATFPFRLASRPC